MGFFNKRKKPNDSNDNDFCYLLLIRPLGDKAVSVPAPDSSQQIPIHEYFQGKHNKALSESLSREFLPAEGFRLFEFPEQVDEYANNSTYSAGNAVCVKLNIKINKLLKKIKAKNHYNISKHMTGYTDLYSGKVYNNTGDVISLESITIKP